MNTSVVYQFLLFLVIKPLTLALHYAVLIELQEGIYDTNHLFLLYPQIVIDSPKTKKVIL